MFVKENYPPLRGFSLIEVAIAMATMALVWQGLVTAQLLSLQKQHQTHYNLQATLAIQQVAEQLTSFSLINKDYIWQYASAAKLLNQNLSCGDDIWQCYCKHQLSVVPDCTSEQDCTFAQLSYRELLNINCTLAKTNPFFRLNVSCESANACAKDVTIQVSWSPSFDCAKSQSGSTQCQQLKLHL